jgi:hypothetical protein
MWRHHMYEKNLAQLVFNKSFICALADQQAYTFVCSDFQHAQWSTGTQSE